MSNLNNNGASFAVVIGVIASIITIFVFLTGWNSIRDIFTTLASPTSSAGPVQPPTTVVSSCGAFVDLGDSVSERGHNLEGWGGRYLDQPPSPSGDTSFRYQSKGSPATVVLCVPQAGVGYILTTEVQDFGCDDSFEIFVNDNPDPIYHYTGTRANVVRVHHVQIPANEITSPYVKLGFQVTSSDCGYAAVYNIGLTQAP